MASGSQRFSLTFLQGVGSAFFILQIISVQADGKVFALESKNNSQGLDLAEAKKACVDLNARLATAEELKRAVLDCSFAGCSTGWLDGGSAGEAVLMICQFGEFSVLYQGCGLLPDDNAYEFAPRHVYEHGNIAAEEMLKTIICRKTGSKQQSVKAIDVKIETDPFVNDHYDAFCVKDEDKPCGDPPSFPHTILHGHTGFEMGDELLYVCAQGYIMGNKETAFTLLCNSCGEWYGQVQACVKDETEAHIDYEDNFPDDRSIPVVENEHVNGKEEMEQEQEQLSFSKSSEERRIGSTKGVTQDTDTSERGSRAPTESPVSLLSQKHLFWFPSEAFNEPESEKETDDSTTAELSEGDNHIGVKAPYDEPGAKMFYDSEDFPIGPILTTNDTKAEIDAVAITDESWLDGYPVTQEVVEDDEEEGDKVDGSMGTEDDVVLTTDQPNHAEVRKPDNGSPAPEEGLTQIVAATTKADDEGTKETPVLLTSVSGLENLSTSRGYDDTAWDHLTTSLETVTQEPGTTMLFDMTSLKTSTSETSVMVSPSDHTPYAEPKDTTTYPVQIATTAPAPDIITGTSSQELAEQENLTQGLGEKPVPTSDPCEEEDCPRSSKGAIIAVIVILLCLLLVAAVLAVWFFKKRQQKNSVYKLNGRCQPRHHCYHHYHHQHIEMQKV